MCVKNMFNHSESSAFVPVSASSSRLSKGVFPSPSQNMTFNPFSSVSTPCLGQSSFLHQITPSNNQFVDFINSANVNFAQKNTSTSLYGPQNKIYNTNSTKAILDLSEKITIIPNQCVGTTSSSSHPPTPSPPVSSGGHGSLLKLRMMEDLPCCIKKTNQWDNGSDKMRGQTKRVKKQNNGKSSDVITKGKWTPDEDWILKEQVNKHGHKKWSKIAMLLEHRIGKQCRERWYNHLEPNLKKGSWTIEEDIMLIKAHKELGSKWAKIAKRIPGRSENTIKNRWNATKKSKNIKAHNKTRYDEYDDSMLRAYIKDVTIASTSQKDKKATTTKKKLMKKHEEEKKNELPIISKGKDKAPLFSDLCNNDHGLTLRLDFPNHDFVQNKCDFALFKNEHMRGN